LLAVVYLNFSTAVFGGFQLETVLIFFGILAVRSSLIALELDTPADSFVAGLCAGCGVMFKPTGLAVLVALTFTLAFCRRRRIILHLLAAGLGLSIPLAVAATYIYQANLLPDMPGLWKQISTYAADTVWSPDDWIKPMTAIVFIGFPMLIYGWVGRRQRPTGMESPKNYLIIFALAWLAIEMTGVLMQRRMYAYHFLPIVPPAALILGLFPRTPRPATLLAALAPMILLNVYLAGGVLVNFNGGQGLALESQYLMAHASPGDAIWMDAWPRIALETNLPPGSRYPFTFLFTNYDKAGLDYSAQMIKDFEHSKPRYIFLPTPLDKRVQNQVDFIPELKFRPERRANFVGGWQRIRDYTLAHYQREGIVGSQEVYRRIDQPQTATAADN
jgi:hypothetical protein